MRPHRFLVPAESATRPVATAGPPWMSNAVQPSALLSSSSTCVCRRIRLVRRLARHAARVMLIECPTNGTVQLGTRFVGSSVHAPAPTHGTILHNFVRTDAGRGPTQAGAWKSVLNSLNKTAPSKLHPRLITIYHNAYQKRGAHGQIVAHNAIAIRTRLCSLIATRPSPRTGTPSVVLGCLVQGHFRSTPAQDTCAHTSGRSDTKPPENIVLGNAGYIAFNHNSTPCGSMLLSHPNM